MHRNLLLYSISTNSWEQRKLSHFSQRESVFRSSSSEYPSVEYEDVVSERGCLNKDIRLKETEKTGIAFDGTQILYGKLRPYLHNWLNPDFKGVAVGDWWVLRPVGIDKKFLYRLIQTRRFDEVANQSSGSKMPRADWNLVSNTEFIIPYSLDEQRQIVETFDSLDNLITLHQRKLDRLKNIKKSMLDKMFPKDGEVVPEIRFKGFTDAWEQRKLGEFTISYSGGTPSVGIKEYYNGQIPFIRSAEINSEITELFLTEEGLKNSSARLVDVGDILYALYGATSGEVGRARLKGAVNQAILVIKPHKEYDSEFLTDWLRKNKESIVETYLQGGQGNLSGTIVKELLVCSPSHTEQEEIGSFFYNLDSLITLHQRKLDKLKNIKKSMLDNMFV